MKVRISPSMMCADLLNLKETLSAMQAQQVEYLHMDIMDGHFVSNFMLGTNFLQDIRKATTIPLDVHMMVERPEDCLAWLQPQPGEIFSVHAESTCHLQRVLGQIREHGAQAVVAINPATPLSAVEEVLPDVSGVLVMTVNPGFAGQKMVPQTLDKIRRLRQLLDERGYEQLFIEVDGNVSLEHAQQMRAAGADTFVLGTSCVFQGQDLEDNIRRFRTTVQ